MKPVASRPLPAMRLMVADVLKSDKFDIVIASTGVMASYAQLAKTGTVKVLEEHNSMARLARDRYQNAVSPLQRVRSWVGLQKRSRFESHYYPRFDLVTMVSEDDRQMTLDTVGLHAPPVVSIPNGVDVRHNRPGLAAVEGPGLVYNGSLTYSANYDAIRYFLAEIYPLIKREMPGVILAITGSTEGVDLGGLAIDESVHLTGYVDDVRLPVARAAVCVSPIRLGGGTRLKILEAMALGTPVVATFKAAEGLEVTDGENILLADDPARFAARTLELLADPLLRERLAANARRLVEDRYDWDHIGRQFVELVEKTAAQKTVELI